MLGGNPFQRDPSKTPGGRGLNPMTGLVGSMPGGMDYLAGFGPAPAGINIPDLPPIVHFASFGPFLPYSNPNFNPAAMRALRAQQFGAMQQAKPQSPMQMSYGMSAQNAAQGVPIFGGMGNFYSR